MDGVEDPRAISDFARGNTSGPSSLSSTESASLFALPRPRRPFHFAERNFRMSMLDQRRWWGMVDSDSDCQARVHVAFCRRPTSPQSPAVVLSIENTSEEQKKRTVKYSCLESISRQSDATDDKLIPANE